ESETRTAAIDTEPGEVVGTPYYMSPEQARSLRIDARTDIFSLGVVLYEMIAGRRPFGGDTKSHAIIAILEKQPLPLRQFNPEVPAELQRIVSKALAKDRDERYQVVKDLQIDLKELLTQVSISSGAASPGPSTPIPTPSRPASS